MTTLKSLPARPSLESLRKQAKKLARDVAAGNADAAARVRAQLPNAEIPLSNRDAQFVLAREYGFAGWQALKEEALKRIGKGLEWAAVQAERAIHDNDVERLRQLLAEHPDLLSWHDEYGGTLLQATTSYANDTSNPKRESEYNRPACAELLIDAGAVVEPSVWERVIDTGASGMLQLLRSKGVLPTELRILAALGDLDSVRAQFDESGALRGADRLRNEGSRVVVSQAFMHACRFRRETVADFLLDRCIALDGDLGRRIEAWNGRAAFVRYSCEHAGPEVVSANAPSSTSPPWRAFAMSQVTRAIHGNDLSAFTHWLRSEPSLLGEAGVEFQVLLLEQIAYSAGDYEERAASIKREAFIPALFDLDPAVLRRRPPPQSPVVRFAAEYGNAHLIPLLTRIWPVTDDLPHAAAMGDFARVKRWFADDGRPALGNLNQHCPVSDPMRHVGLGWGANSEQQILDTALAWACMNRQFEIASFLLDHGADINTRWSTHEPASILHECTLRDNREGVQFLIDRGIDVTIRCYRYNATAQGWAYNATGNMELAELLAKAEEEQGRRA
jgi:ankyrin repeat protein